MRTPQNGLGSPVGFPLKLPRKGRGRERRSWFPSKTTNKREGYLQKKKTLPLSPFPPPTKKEKQRKGTLLALEARRWRGCPRRSPSRLHPPSGRATQMAPSAAASERWQELTKPGHLKSIKRFVIHGMTIGWRTTKRITFRTRWEKLRVILGQQ